MSHDLPDFEPPEPALVERIRAGINAVRERNGRINPRESDEDERTERPAPDR